MTPVHRPSRRRGAVVTIGGFLVLGLVVGWLWSVLAEPAAYSVTRDGAVMGETEAANQFGVNVAFAWLGALVAVLWGGICAFWFAGHGWPHVISTLLGALAASALAWRLGILFGPPPPEPVVKAAEVGSKVPMQVRVDSYGVLLAWPIAALIGLLVVVTWIAPNDGDDVTP